MLLLFAAFLRGLYGQGTKIENEEEDGRLCCGCARPRTLLTFGEGYGRRCVYVVCYVRYARKASISVVILAGRDDNEILVVTEDSFSDISRVQC